MKAVLFDMDGILIDTEKYLTGYKQKAMREAGYRLDLETAYKFRSCASVFAREQMKGIFGEDFPYDELRRRRQELMSDHIARFGIEKKPYVEETIKELKRRGYQTAVVTATAEDRAVRYLENIMGLWMIQSVRHEYDDKYGFAEICQMAEEAKDFPSRVDANDECFLSPESMIEEVKDYCRRTGQKVPETLGEIATVIYTSLAECYAKTAKELEEMTGRTFSRIHVVGGGSNAGYLNELTARATGKEVHAGPGEATAIGNITAQMLKAEEFKSIEEARTTIHESFGIKVYQA